MATPEQIKELAALSLARYEEDGGVMYECYGPQDRAELIDAEGGVEAAWASHIRINEARREAYGYYEKF
jgi:hypothetical protein